MEVLDLDNIIDALRGVLYLESGHYYSMIIRVHRMPTVHPSQPIHYLKDGYHIDLFIGVEQFALLKMMNEVLFNAWLGKFEREHKTYQAKTVSFWNVTDFKVDDSKVQFSICFWSENSGICFMSAFHESMIPCNTDVQDTCSQCKHIACRNHLMKHVTEGHLCPRCSDRRLRKKIKL